ncbi:toll/interleukin-1 receptor domain-containing protein [Nostoc sp. C057]|uniref:toll/interleukin-1 receptor domain-containing protein n=1 Tax=Nostoc sp. C057 TaxID=2576903 RepID=UPI0015C3DBC9|nr:toll/interleukin-1 receptor domain-containing protein [Nostoc sp. C057]QLE48133.1 toll/interleukin-1 receptor domain-containing protein [Nostoc sp. C057]
MSNTVKVFFSYSHKDEALRDELATHLSMMKRQGVIEAWHDREISAGREWANEIDDNLDIADIILLLVSANFLASDYCYDKEMKRAMERHQTREARVIPIILKPVDDWNSAPFGKLQALPQNAKPITSWQDQDEAFLNVAQGIRRVVKEMAKSNTSSLTPAKNTTPATSSPSGTSGVLTERQRRRWEQERDSVQEQYDFVSKKLGLLGKAHAIETDVSTKLKLEVQIQDTKTEQNRLERQLEEIEQKLL